LRRSCRISGHGEVDWTGVSVGYVAAMRRRAASAISGRVRRVYDAVWRRVNEGVLARSVRRTAAFWLLAAALACGHDETRALRPVTDGVAVDSRTGLQWTTRDHEESLAWPEAERHCRDHSTAGGGWRLPEIGELQALYDPASDEPCGAVRCHLDPLIRLGSPYVWSASPRSPGTRFYFDFSTGTSLSPDIRPTLVRRVLCVRRS